jgi:peptidoglycan/LPS O-acetylase OafA/YrhL
MAEPMSQRFEALDAWRGICAVLVAAIHMPSAHAWQGTTPFGNMQLFVDFFFVLSGFVICHAYGTRISGGITAAGFMIRRFGRLWPLHAAVLLGFVVFEFAKIAVEHGFGLALDGAAFANNRSVPSLMSNVFLIQSFNLHGMTTWNGPAWSIGTEFYTYAVFAGAVLLVKHRTLAFAVLATVGLAGVVANSEAWLFTTHDFGFFRCVYGFFSGCLVYGLVRRGKPSWAQGTTVEVAVVAGLIGYLLNTGRDPSSLLAPMVFGLIVYVFAFESGAVSRLLKQRWAQALGLWSYSIYMVHMLLYAGFKVGLSLAAKFGMFGITVAAVEPVKMWTFNNAALDVGAVVLAVAASVYVARWSYAWIEHPGRDWFGDLASRLERRDFTSGRADLGHDGAR